MEKRGYPPRPYWQYALLKCLTKNVCRTRCYSKLHYTALVRKSELERTTFAKHYQGKTTSREQVPVRNALLVIQWSRRNTALYMNSFMISLSRAPFSISCSAALKIEGVGSKFSRRHIRSSVACTENQIQIKFLHKPSRSPTHAVVVR
jgi:hypothetical protein